MEIKGNSENPSVETINGSNGHDTIWGDYNLLISEFHFGGDDLLYGNAGDDRIYGGTGKDKVHGGDGDDTIYGSYSESQIDDWYYHNRWSQFNDSNNYLAGGDGDDTIYGGNARDVIFGEWGSDTIYGGEGDDLIYASGTQLVSTKPTDNDQIQGGNGADTFVFVNTAGSATIKDYNQGEGDIIYLGNYVSNGIDDNGNVYFLGSAGGRMTLEGVQSFDDVTLVNGTLDDADALADGILGYL